ncbi:MAG: dephospho-CoA kinase [Lachnospiraceae bacterium]|nr:dephospho-CoA kinase [Lachnospiraceae bacterium]
MKQNKAYIIGITGGVGTGKSKAMDYLEENYECLVIKADDIGNLVKLKGNECYQPIINLLGKDILDPSCEIDKKIMASKIFNDKELLEKVNAIIHPAVRKRIDDCIEKNIYKYKYILIEAALLVQANYLPVLNELWEIKCSKEVRIERLCESRGYSKEKAESIINSQVDDNYYEIACTEYINTTDRNDFFGYKPIINDMMVEFLYIQLDAAMEVINESIGER